MGMPIYYNFNNNIISLVWKRLKPLFLGTSFYIGGTIKAAAHYDTIVTNANLELDGKLIFRNKDLLI